MTTMKSLLNIPKFLRRESSKKKSRAVPRPTEREWRIGVSAPVVTERQITALGKLGWDRGQAKSVSPQDADIIIQLGVGPEARFASVNPAVIRDRVERVSEPKGPPAPKRGHNSILTTILTEKFQQGTARWRRWGEQTVGVTLGQLLEGEHTLGEIRYLSGRGAIVFDPPMEVGA